MNQSWPPPHGTNTDSIARETIFWILAIASTGAALAMILVRRAVHCALMLAVVMLSLATMYAMQGAPFLAFVQIIVYTGAVLMLFLFVIMLIGISSADSIVETIKGQRMAAGLIAIGLFVILILGIGHAAIGPAKNISPGQRGGQPDRPGPADLHHLRVPVRGHRRAADHRGARGHGAGAPGAHRAQADPARPGSAPAGQRAARARPGARRLRAARRGGPAGVAARRDHVAGIGQLDPVAA